MIIEAALYAHLSTHAGLSALVSTRVYPLRLPQDPILPAVVYEKVSGPRIRTLGNTVQGSRPRFQLTCWAATYLGAKAVVAQVQAALEGFSGTMGGAGGVTVRAAEQGNEVDHHDDDTGRFAVVLDFIIHVEGA